MKLTLHEIAKIVGSKNDVAAYEDVAINQIEFDSRKITAGDLFLPLKGARDGHDFIQTAFDNGALATFTEKDLPADQAHILVDDALEAFQKLAAYYLEKTGVDVIAVTGSNGKTTTKDMIHDILATTYRTYKTQGNYNNEIGLPYTALHMPDDTEKIVLEMGQDHMGDIHLLSTLAKPKTAVVTLIGEVVRFGDGAELTVSELTEFKDHLTFSTNFLDGQVTLPVTGKYNATNAMVAAYVAKHLGVTEENILTALANLQLTKNRTEWKKAANSADILSDVYNANPTAMKLILETFSAIPKNEGGKKIAVLADMKELGEQSVQLHTQMILSLTPDAIDTVIFYGEDIAELSQLASQMFPLGHVYYFKKTADEDQFDAMVKQIKESLGEHDQILLKGSNSMNLAKVVEELQAKN